MKKAEIKGKNDADAKDAESTSSSSPPPSIMVIDGGGSSQDKTSPEILPQSTPCQTVVPVSLLAIYVFVGTSPSTRRNQIPVQANNATNKDQRGRSYRNTSQYSYQHAR